MQPFEFVMILVSIIVALGVAELLSGTTRILRGNLKAYWVHSVWILIFLVMELQYCWSLFDLEAKENWVFLDLIRLVWPPVALYLVSSLHFPEDGLKGDLESLYYERRRPVFFILGLLMVFYTVLNRGWDALTLVQVLAVGIVVALIVSERPSIHRFATLAFALGTFFITTSYSYRLGESGF